MVYVTISDQRQRLQQAHWNLIKFEQIGDELNRVASPPDRKLNWDNGANIEEGTMYKDITRNFAEGKSGLYFARWEKETNELVVYVVGEELARYKPGDFYVEIQVGGEFLGRSVKKRVFKGRLHLDANGHLVLRKKKYWGKRMENGTEF